MNSPTITITTAGGARTVGLTVAHTMPFGQSLWGTKLPDNATLDSAHQAAWVAELVRQSKLSAPWLNATKWTLEPLVVGPDVPKVPVTCHSGDSHLNAALAEGVPIPPGTVPTSDSDSALAIWQPSSDKYWELQAAHQDPTTGAWSANFGARAGGVSSATRSPHYVSYVTGPAGTYEAPTWGTQGSALPYWPGVITSDDVRRGRINHVLLLEVYNAGTARAWPAQRTDGTTPMFLSDGVTPNPQAALLEGQRGRLPANYTIATGLTPMEQLVHRGLIEYGYIITDKTLSSLAMRAAPSAAALGMNQGSALLAHVPWQDMLLLQAGTDANPIPVG